MPVLDSFWWYVTMEGEKVPEEVMASLADLSGSIGTEQHDQGEKIRIRAYYRSSQDLGFWMQRIKQTLDPWPEISVVDTGKIENQKWHTEWKEAFPPLEVGKTFIVMAPWHKGKEPAGRIPLYIYPGSAFGTGYHESTQIVLSLLERHLRRGDVVADIGTGSAILSIAALKMGASHVFSRDIDPAVSEEVYRNLNQNSIPHELVDFKTGNLLQGFDHKVDLLLANIVVEPLKRMIPDVKTILTEKGRAIFSGLVTREKNDFIQILESNGLLVTDEITCSDWWGVLVEIA